MTARETEIGGDGRGFPPTSWTALGALRDGDEATRRRRLEDLIARYWKPVYCVIRASWSKSNEDAKDLTQEFFVRAVLEGSLAEGFAPSKGSFRTFLKGALSHFMLNSARDAATLKRGGSVKTLRLDDDGDTLGTLVAAAGTLPPDKLFDGAWKEEVLGRALRGMEQRLKDAGKGDCFRVFQRYELGSTVDAPSYQEVADELGLTSHVVKHALATAREEYRRAVTEQLRSYADTPELLAHEIRDLFGS